MKKEKNNIIDEKTEQNYEVDDVYSIMKQNINEIQETPEQYIIKLRKKVIEEIKNTKETVNSEKQVKLLINNTDESAEVKILKNEFTILVQDNEYKFFLENSTSYIMSEKPTIRITYKELYIHIERNNNIYYVVTNQNIKVNHQIHSFSKEKDVVSFYIIDFSGFEMKDNILVLKEEIIKKEDDELQDNDTLIISPKDGKVYLPYKLEEIKREVELQGNITAEELIKTKYILSITIFTNSIKARFIEAYKLMRFKEKKSVGAAIWLGLELMLEFNLHPAIITACKNMEELDIYLDCLDDNELDKFSCFKIIYKSLPVVKVAKI